jgi:hypothetical protein
MHASIKRELMIPCVGTAGGLNVCLGACVLT